MENLYIEGTKKTPYINFNATTGNFELKGRWLIEHSGFSPPIFGELDKYIKKDASYSRGLFSRTILDWLDKRHQEDASYPGGFSRPILDWLDKYIQEPASKTNVIIYLENDDYTDAVSLALIRILRRLELIEEVGGKVNIQWFHDDDHDGYEYNEYLTEYREDLEDLIKLPFEFIKAEL